MASNLRKTAVGTGVLAALVIALVALLGNGRAGSSSADDHPATGVHRTVVATPLATIHPPAPPPDPPTSGIPESNAEHLDRLCPDLWHAPSEACLHALDARFSGEKIVAGPIVTPLGWNPRLAEVRARSAPLASLGGPTWSEVFENPSETRQAVADALSRPECAVPEGHIRPRLRDQCAAGEMAKLAMLHQACVGLLVRDDAHREFGMHDVYEEEWRFELADRVEEPDHEAYWRQVAEVEEERLRFAWRLHRCRSVPQDALALLDAFPAPGTRSRRHGQGGHLVVAAARLGHEWATAWGMLGNREDMAALRDLDPALASLVEATNVTELQKNPIEHLILAVELSHRHGKPWHHAALETLIKRYTNEEIREAIPNVSDRIPFEPAVVIDL